MINITIDSKLFVDEAEVKVREIILRTMQMIDNIGISYPQINEIILTDDLFSSINDDARNFNLSDISLTKEKEFSAVAKNISVDINGEKFKRIHIDAQIVLSDHFLELLVQQVISGTFQASLPTFLSDDLFWPYSKIEAIISCLVGSLIITTLEFNFVRDFGILTKNDNESAKHYVDQFKRKIKEVHYTYQETYDVKWLRVNAVTATHTLIQRCLESFLHNDKITELDPFSEEVEIIINEIVRISELCPKIDYNELLIIEEKFKDILSKCFFTMLGCERTNEDAGILITKNPHLLFKGNYVETEQRIVAFIDILGFKSIIEEYDADKYSTSLKELKEALDQSIIKATSRIEADFAEVQILNWGVKEFYRDFSELIDYRMFSDCFSISLPFFNNNKDFTLQFASLALTVRIFQYYMLSKGFLVRGGISFGSYYSDNNMLFSGGLVKAYELESKLAKMPRIIIDKAILDKLKEQNLIFVHLLGLAKALIIDTDFDNSAFLNPFDLDSSTNIKLKEFTANIDNLYKDLQVEGDYSELKDLLKTFADLIPEFPAELTPSSELKKLIPEMDYSSILERFYFEVARLTYLLENEADIEKKEKIKSALQKNVWLLDLLKWRDSSEKNFVDRFTFLWK